MKNNDAFLYKNLTAYDQILFVRAFQTALEHFGKESCWCLTKMNNAGFKGFTTSKKTKLMYKGHDARPLILSMTGRNYSEKNPINLPWKKLKKPKLIPKLKENISIKSLRLNILE